MKKEKQSSDLPVTTHPVKATHPCGGSYNVENFYLKKKILFSILLFLALFKEFLCNPEFCKIYEVESLLYGINADYTCGIKELRYCLGSLQII